MYRQDYLLVLGRLLLSAIFLISGFSKFTGWEEASAYMATKGFPLIPFFLSAAALVEIIGGLSLLLAWKPRWGSGFLFLYLIPVTLLFHNFWAYSGTDAATQMIHFLKNLSILGGLLIISRLPERTVKARSEILVESEDLTRREVA